MLASFQKHLVNLGAFLGAHKADLTGALIIFKLARNEETQ